MLPILYINLDRDPQRRTAMERSFDGLPLQRISGVLWTALPPSEQDALYSPALSARQFHKPLVNGEKGCYASHIAVWRWLLASPHAGVILLEDDVRPAPGFAVACEALSRNPEGWDMVKLIGRPGLGKPEKLRGRQPLCTGFERVDYRRVPSLTAGYALSRRGAEKLLAHRVPFGRPIDVDLRHWWECAHLRVQGLEPAAIELDDTSLDSSIGAKVAERSLADKWRKFRHKLNYSLGNAWHGRGR
ncbi:MAG: glycosyltransferase family 25 protein [Inhella sp.]|uniref:glycosyltransferase family 25 protein n=1 Tax=Inhella sp. TaxID=1921806 RepID=UPI00391F2686